MPLKNDDFLLKNGGRFCNSQVLRAETEGARPLSERFPSLFTLFCFTFTLVYSILLYINSTMLHVYSVLLDVCSILLSFYTHQFDLFSCPPWQEGRIGHLKKQGHLLRRQAEAFDDKQAPVEEDEIRRRNLPPKPPAETTCAGGATAAAGRHVAAPPEPGPVKEQEMWENGKPQLNPVMQQARFCTEDDGFCTGNDGLCTEDGGFCTENDWVCRTC